MAADSKLILPGDFQAGKTYLIKGDTLLEWRKALLADRIVPGPDQTETQTPQGRAISGGKGGGTATSPIPLRTGAFYGLYQIDGHTFFQCGNCTSGSGSQTFADQKVIDASNGPTFGAGTLMVIRATVKGYAPDGVLLGGLTQTSASLAHVTSIPDDTLPTVNALSGRQVHIEVGRWNASGFTSSSSGHIRISFCPGGGYTITRD